MPFPNFTKENAKQYGSQGGLKTVKRYGAEYVRDLGRKAIKIRWEKYGQKLHDEADGQSGTTGTTHIG